jgi:hypothetical protein
MAQRCRVCSHPEHQLIDSLLTSGTPDLQIAKRFGIETVSVGRHRRAHLLKPTQDRLAILSKDSAARQERQMLAEAAASDAPSTQALIEATLGMRRQMEKLISIEQRLERMSAAAESASSSAGVAQLSAQQLRSIEVGAKLGSVGGYKPPSVVSPMADKATVSIEFVFQNAPKETIALTSSPVIDGDLSDPNSETPFPSPPPKQKFQGSIRDYWNFSEQHHSAQGEDDPKED